jgi:hypothetical protein
MTQPFTDAEVNAAVAATVDELRRQLDSVRSERDTAISMLAAWCIMVDINGSGWDDWDEGYKDAMHRPCQIRELLDVALAKERRKWKEEYGRE